MFKMSEYKSSNTKTHISEIGYYLQNVLKLIMLTNIEALTRISNSDKYVGSLCTLEYI